jgi:hypothetical protein
MAWHHLHATHCICPLQVEERMFEAVHAAVAAGVASYPATPRHHWVLDAPGQVNVLRCVVQQSVGVVCSFH